MLENLKRQEAVLPTIDRAKTLEMLFQLQTLYFGDDEAVAKYGKSAYWDDLATGGGERLMCCRTVDADAVPADNNPNQQRDVDTQNTPMALLSNLLENIASKGYHVLPPPPNRREGRNQSSTAFSSTLEALANAGWPPQFLLMYDETWELLKDAVRGIVGDECDWDNVTIESDVNIWSLRDCPPGTYYIGGNFINPHRDMVYDACHDEDERPTSLSVWIPLNPSGATESNGCMRVLPIESDDFFYCPQHPRHSMNSEYTDEDAEKLTVAQFGCGVWDPSCVHWGGSYEADQSDQEPRSSLAFTIRLGGKAADFGTSASRIPGGTSSPSDQAEETGPKACLVKNCDKGGPKRRLQVVAKSLLSYSHHWPGFPGFEGLRENLGI
mmetsp:Transcript_8380/g.13584  ORF Transcript_8380/g.13584 Transcript_8380/m.13584 type:complete len:382 (-) Transcript_8380:40-1185(-)